MQDRYVADVGDFGKYGLLRALCEQTRLKLGIIWYYTIPAERERKNNQNDGRHIGYLESSSRSEYEACDKVLFNKLKTIIGSPEEREERRRLSSVETFNILAKDTVFCRDEVPEKSGRDDWFKRAFRKVTDCDLIFLDPDNGLWIPSNPNSRKHILEKELRLLLGDQDKSVIVYQHGNRSRGGLQTLFDTRRLEIEELAGGKRKVGGLFFHRGTARLFFIIPSPKHEGILANSSLHAMLKLWIVNKHFSIAGQPNH